MAVAEPAHEMSREAANLLRIAADSGEPVSESSLREQLGVGHDDLRLILDQLREAGMASEVAPGEWSGAVEEPPEPRAVAVSVPDEIEEEIAAPEREPVFFSRHQPTVRLTRAIANALDPDALGKLVKAGIDDCAADEAFVMEVVP